MRNNFRIILFILCILLFSSVFCFADTPEDDILSTPEVTVLRVSPTDTSGFHAVMLSLIGDYNPIVKDYTYTNQSGYISHSIDIQPDWSWIASCATFCLVFFCFMLFLGKLFTR